MFLGSFCLVTIWLWYIHMKPTTNFFFFSLVTFTIISNLIELFRILFLFLFHKKYNQLFSLSLSLFHFL